MKFSLSAFALAAVAAAAMAAPASLGPAGQDAVTARKQAKLLKQSARFRGAKYSALQKTKASTGFDIPSAAISEAGVKVAQSSDCSSYTSEIQCRDVAPESASCVWSLPHGSTSDWDEEDEVCRSTRCSDVENVETIDGDESASCATFLGGSCTWHADDYVCWETGQELPCEFKGAWEESMCPSPCVWNEEDYNHPCSTAGNHEPCGQAYDSASCTQNNPDCRWQAGSGSSGPDDYDECGTCYNATRFGADVPCDGFFTKPQSCCPTARCRWTVVMEAPDDLPPDEGEMADGRCTAQTEDLACEQYEDEADCPRPRCDFFQNDYEGVCVAAGRAIPCERLEPRTCHLEISCNWVSEDSGDDDMGICTTCPTSNCTQPYNGGGGPDDGAPCAQHSASNCPMDDFPPRCSVHYPSDDEDDGGMDYNDWECASGGGDMDEGTCGDPTCEDSYEQDECTAITGCSWNDDIYACYSTAGGLPCDRIFEQTSCSGTCSWQSAPTGCGDDEFGDNGVCVNAANPQPPCKAFDVVSAACCPTHCTWHDDTSMCTDSDYQKSCESYGSRISGTDACPTDRCAVSHGVCHTQGETVGCNDICNKFVCTSSGDCHWNDDEDGSSTAAQCVDGAAALEVCNTLTQDQCYNAEHCAYLGNSCVEGVCSDIFSAEVCGAWSGAPHNCVYNEMHGCSFADEQLQCDQYYETSSCPSDRCHYDSTCYLCMDTGEVCPCHLFWSQDECPSGRCTWSGQSCELNSGDDTPPTLNGGGDHDITHCTSAMKTNLRPVLDAAVQDCVDESATPGAATAEQIKCLDYYVKHANSPTTLTAACPCLRWWAEHESPEMGYWMDLDC